MEKIQASAMRAFFAVVAATGALMLAALSALPDTWEHQELAAQYTRLAKWSLLAMIGGGSAALFAYMTAPLLILRKAVPFIAIVLFLSGIGVGFLGGRVLTTIIDFDHLATSRIPTSQKAPAPPAETRIGPPPSKE